MKTKLLLPLFLICTGVYGITIDELVASRPKTLPTQIINDWKWQDGASSANYRDVISSIINSLPSDRRGPLQTELQSLASVDQADPRFEALYLKVCNERRAQRMLPYYERIKTIAFQNHPVIGGAFLFNNEAISFTDMHGSEGFFTGSSIQKLSMNGIYGTATTLLNDPTGQIRDLDVSFDGKKILFAWKKSAREDDYHLYELTAADNSVRQITSGLGMADFEGIYLPNNEIIFSSTRCFQALDCWYCPVPNLYRCDTQGRYLRRLGYDQVHTNFPQLLPDGRVLYLRWDYNDRGHTYTKTLFTMNPDGTHQIGYYNNNAWWPTGIIHARGIPNSTKVMAIACGYHVKQSGKLCLIDISKGLNDTLGLTQIGVKTPTPREVKDTWGTSGEQFAYPYPLDETTLLVSRSENRSPYYLYLYNVNGTRELLNAAQSMQAMPLLPRTAPKLPSSSVDYTKTKGEFSITDIYYGESLKGIARGTIKKLRVVALDYRAFSVGASTHKGPGEINTVGVTYTTPVAAVNGTWDVKRVLGETEVHEDGSARFLVPARTPVYFQALNAKNEVVQTMRSWATLQPGEVFSCAGCHEDKLQGTPVPPVTPLALRQPAKELVPFYGAPRGFSFAKEIQPILNAKCISCHNATHIRGVDLREQYTSITGTEKNWLTSYNRLVKYANWVDAAGVPTLLPPYSAGSFSSKIVTMLDAGHKQVSLTKEEFDKIRCWIDLGVPHCGEYTEGMNDAAKTTYNKFLKLRTDYQVVEEQNISNYLKSLSTNSHNFMGKAGSKFEQPSIFYANNKIVVHSMHVPFSVKITTLTGKSVVNKVVSSNPKALLSLSKKSSSIYLLHYTYDNYNFVKKIHPTLNK